MSEKVKKERKVKPEHDLRIPGATPKQLVQAVVKGKGVQDKKKRSD